MDLRTQPIECPHCKKMCAGSAGLASHVRSMHAEKSTNGAASSDGLVWKEPPKSRGSKHAETLAALKTRPGAWAQVQTGLASSRANGVATALKKLGAEAVSRRNGDGHDVYARWPGSS